MFNINDKHRYMQRQAPFSEDIEDKINNQFNFLFDKFPTYIQTVVHSLTKAKYMSYLL